VTSPTQRSLAYLRSRGIQVGKVGDFWNQYARIRQDLWGFADLLCVRSVQAAGEWSSPAIFLVQATSGANHAARRDKILGIPAAKAWLEVGGGILILSWARRGERGKVKRWQAREEWLAVLDFLT